jgi:phage gp36-like protein
MTTTYSTDSDIRLRVGDYALQRWTGGTGGSSYDPTVVDYHRVQSFDLINAKLYARYAEYLPSTGDAIPAVLRSIEVDITVYRMATTFEKAGESYLQNYKDALTLLEALASGEVALISGGENLTESFHTAEVPLAMSTTVGQSPIFSRATLEPLMRRRY